MKNITFLLLLFTGMLQAQSFINFTDANLKSKILASDTSNEIAYGNGGYIKVDANADGEIDEIEALEVDSLNIFSANIANLTGVNAFTNLKKIDCSNNAITQFDGTGLTDISYLNIGQNPMTSANITMLVNMKMLFAQNTNLNAVNVLGMPQLEILNVGSSGLTSLNLTGLSNLKYLYCFSNSLTALDLSDLNNLIYVDCRLNQLPLWSVSNLPSLKVLHCSQNMMTTLTLQNLPVLDDIDCSQNLLTSLIFSGIPNIHTFNCDQNRLSTLDFSGFDQLNRINCSDNLLTDLRLNNSFSDAISVMCQNNLLTSLNLENLEIDRIDCWNNSLTNVNLNGIRGMGQGYFQNNQLTALVFPENSLGIGDRLDVSDNPLTTFKLPNLSLFNFNCTNTLVTSLDFSNSPAIINESTITDNPVLQYINVKNGNRDFCMSPQSPCVSWILNNNPQLQFICVDDLTVNSFSEESFFLELTDGVTVSPYCSFTPSGTYNIITGQVRFDSANDGCANDPFQPNVKLTLNDGSQDYATIITTSGNYKFYTLAGNFIITPAVENPEIFTIAPQTATVNFPDSNNNLSTQNFCMTANGVHPDLEIVLVPIINARPGFDATYKIVYKNKGNQIISGNLLLAFDTIHMDLINSFPLFDGIDGGILSYNFSNLLPFESREIVVRMNINTPEETNPVNIGDVLVFTVNVPVSADDTPNDNTFELNQVVIGSYDPNDITCLQGEAVSPDHIGKYLHYNINFENTGTADAENIVVRDSIDTAKYDIHSLQILNSSHAMDVKVKGNVIEFIFEGIHLRPSRTNPIGGHGNVLFKIKSKTELQAGSFVETMANIYFDYNAPIETNEAKTTFELLNNQEFNRDYTIKIHPNPVNDFVKIEAKNTLKSIQLFDIQGRILQTVIENKKETTLDLSKQSNGIYFLKINTEKGSKVEKIVKE